MQTESAQLYKYHVALTIVVLRHDGVVFILVNICHHYITLQKYCYGEVRYL